MTTDTKRGEKPTLLSKRVLRTSRVNVTEAVKLQERLGQYKSIQRQKEQVHEDNVFGLRFNLRKISRVKEKMEVSAMRRKFLAEHGVNLKIRDVNMDDFVSAVGSSLSKGKASHASTNTLNDNDSVLDPKSSTFSEFSDGTNAETFPLHLPVDVIKRKGKQRYLASSSLYSDSDSDNEAANRAQIQSSNNRPKSGKSSPPIQFRMISPPNTGRRVIDVYKELEEEEKQVQKMIEEKKFQQRLKKNEAWKEKLTDTEKHVAFDKGRHRLKKPGIIQNKNVVQTANISNIKQSKYRMDDSMNKVNFKEEKVVLEDSTDNQNNPNEQGEIIEYDFDKKHKGTGELKEDLDDEFDKLMKKYLQLSEENKREKSAKNSQRLGVSNNEDKKINKGIIYGAALSSSALKKSIGYSKGREDSIAGSTRDEMNSPKESNLSPNLSEWRKLVSKTKEGIKTREAAFRSSSTSQGKGTITRMPRPASVGRTINRDATGSKSVMKGYATMQMTVGKRAISIYVPRFENEAVCNGQAAGRANVKSCFEVEQVREKREMHKKRSFTFD